MSRTEAVGILNLTPDSFSGDGVYYDVDAAAERSHQLFLEGARYVDIGAESTRPGARPVGPAEEWGRLEPVLQKVVAGRAESFSIDSRHPETIRRVAAEIGPVIINDVTGMNNPAMREAAGELGLRLILSHLPVMFGDDIQAAHYGRHKVSSKQQVVDELLSRVEDLKEGGVDPGAIILDPGIGFGKTMKLNWELLEIAKDLPAFDVMIGYSNKRFLCADPETGEYYNDHEERRGSRRWMDQMNVLAGERAAKSGAALLRVHDVKLHRELLRR